MMPSLSGVRWIVIALLLLCRRTSAQSVEMRCSMSDLVGKLHPVQALLERFEAGKGCAARERGNKETHAIAVGRVTNSPDNKVTVILKPLSQYPSPFRAINLLLSSKLPITWWLEAERLPPSLPVVVQISANSNIKSHSLHLHVQTVPKLPFHPRVLHHWALKHHGNLSSLTHTTQGNRVYVALGEDPTLPDVCHLQSMFLSRNYIASDVQQQEVHGCANLSPGGVSPEVHVIKLHSAGSGLCGSLQVEVIVSLLPLVANSKTQKVVLILSSLVAVNWSIIAHGVRGHISVHSSNSVSPIYPHEPDLTLSSTVNSDLTTILDLLVWANESGYTKVTSYTEAVLANRFVIQLAGGGTVIKPLVARPPWTEERRLRQLLNSGVTAEGRRESFAVQCDDGRLSVTMDQHILQSLSASVNAVTLRDSTCQAQSNGSHFLLVFPVFSCGTETLLLEQPRGVQYKNMVLLWRDKPQTILVRNETEQKSNNQLGIHFSCLAAFPTLPSPADSIDGDVNTPQTGLVLWTPQDSRPVQELSHLPASRHKSEPLLILKLFVTERYEQRRIGPCVITADQRVYVEISAKGPHIDTVEVNSCVVSPLSDPKKSPFWTIISDGCSLDTSLSLDGSVEAEQGGEGSGDLEEENEETEGLEKRKGDGKVLIQHKIERRQGEASARMSKRGTSMGVTEEIKPLRLSFILRAVYNESVQFLHCSLRLCISDFTRGKAMKETVKKDCPGGRRIPPLVSRSTNKQCGIRNLSRPMVVTHPMSSLAHNQPVPSPGQRTKRLSVSTVTSLDPEHYNSMAQTGLVMGLVFAVFVMGVSLMGGLWCIYYTGTCPASLREDRLTEQTDGVHVVWNSLSDQCSSSV